MRDGLRSADAVRMTTTTPMTDPIDAPSWTIRPERPLDLDQIHDLHRVAFARAAEADLVDAIRSGPTFIPELSLVAVTGDGSVLGHIMVSGIELAPVDEEAGRIPVLALAPIAVLPQHQGRGIGSALIRQALAVADERDEPMMAVVGAPALYGRFGFVAADQLGVTGPYDDAGEASQGRARPGASVPAGRLVYPSAFGAV
jgi:predicted N-acetyltransferase YhbS